MPELSVPVDAEEKAKSLPVSHSGHSLYLRVRRVADVGCVLLAAPAALIIIALCSISILILMGRPIFFTQSRVGLRGKPFSLFKLRTMIRENSRRDHATLVNDARITPLGVFLRRSHFDELPQLWNILKGEMALIGPRPEQPHLVALYRKEIAGYDVRHSVPPGLTGLAQVQFGYAADLEDTRQKVKYDVEYVANIGPSIDLRIMYKTLLVYADPNYVR